MAKAKKSLPNVDTEKRGGAEIKKLLEEGAKEYPSLIAETKKKKASKATKRVTKSLSMPEYVWELIFEASYKERQPQGVVVMKALKKIGYPIDDEDLVDGRKS